MRYVGKIDREVFRCVAEDIATDEVVMTEERIEHIMERHPGQLQRISPYLHLAVSEPDYILEDRSPNTALILKEVAADGLRMQIVLRLHTAGDTPGFKNSVISAWEISSTRWMSYLRNKKVLYIRE